MRDAADKALDASSKAEVAAGQTLALGAGPDRWRLAKQALVGADSAQVEAQVLLGRAGGLGREQMASMKREVAASRAGKPAAQPSTRAPMVQPLPTRKLEYGGVALPTLPATPPADTAEGRGLTPAPAPPAPPAPAPLAVPALESPPPPPPAPLATLAPLPSRPPPAPVAPASPPDSPVARAAGAAAFTFTAVAMGAFVVGGRRFVAALDASLTKNSTDGVPENGLFGKLPGNLFGVPMPDLRAPDLPFSLPRPAGVKPAVKPGPDAPAASGRPAAATPPIRNGRAQGSEGASDSAKARPQPGTAGGSAQAPPVNRDGWDPVPDPAAMQARARANADAAVRAAAAKRKARAAPDIREASAGSTISAKAYADADAAVKAAAGRLAAEAAAGASMGDAGQAAAVEMSPEVRAAAEAAAAAEAKAHALEARAAALDAQAAALSERLAEARKRPPNESEPDVR
mmetsp:Transcript_24527/g.79160  ORF Transcript_24527/g.79160 Transcript_24527/m.79160 type:complete len:459 (+) Transcript_24527:1261-2637(+)